MREVVESPRAGLLKLLLVGEGLEGAGDGVRTALLDHGFAHIILEGDVHEREACLIDDRGFSIFSFSRLNSYLLLDDEFLRVLAHRGHKQLDTALLLDELFVAVCSVCRRDYLDRRFLKRP